MKRLVTIASLFFIVFNSSAHPNQYEFTPASDTLNNYSDSLLTDSIGYLGIYGNNQSEATAIVELGQIIRISFTEDFKKITFKGELINISDSTVMLRTKHKGVYLYITIRIDAIINIRIDSLSKSERISGAITRGVGRGVISTGGLITVLGFASIDPANGDGLGVTIIAMGVGVVGLGIAVWQIGNVIKFDKYRIGNEWSLKYVER